MTELSVEDFLLTQHYQNPELQQQLKEILQAIPVWKPDFKDLFNLKYF